MLRLSILLPFLFLASPGEARTRADCDKIANPMEFNLCLASLAPPKARRVPRGQAAPADADEPRGRRARAARPAEEGPVKNIGGGRKRIEFPVR